MIFLDSSFLIAFYRQRDVHYNKAIEIVGEIMNGEHGRTFISDYVFDEVATYFLNRGDSLEISVKVGDKIKESIEILNSGSDVFEETWETFKSQKNTKLSFTDCNIIEIMKREGIKNLATFDKEFKKVKGIKIVQ